MRIHSETCLRPRGFIRRVTPLLAGLMMLASGLAQSGTDKPLAFVDVSVTAGVNATHRAIWDPDGVAEGYLAMGQAWGDYDNDGWVDLYVTGNLDGNVLYHNEGDGTFSVAAFSESLSLPNTKSGGALWGDYDNDGWLDLYVLNFGANVLFYNNSGKGFTDVTERAGIGDTGKAKSATWGDYDRDGYLDLYVVNWSCIPECDPEVLELSQDRLYHNDGDGRFTDVTDDLLREKTLGAGFAASFIDYDNDGDADLYVVNDKIRNSIGNVLWRNDGAGCGHWCWTDVSEEAGTNAVIHGMGLAVGDYNNDGSLDFYVSNMMSPMVLLQNAGNGTFDDVTQVAGVGINPPGTAVGWGTGFFDYDNDGWLDLYLAATGMPKLSGSFYGGSQPDMEDFRHSYPDTLFRNNGDGTFTDVGNNLLVGSDRPNMGFAYADYDNDGWMDAVVGTWNEGYRLYHNEGTSDEGHGWLTVRLVGGGPVNRDAVGTRVYLTTSDGRTQMQEVISGSSLGAGNDLALHFGLGRASIDRVKVVWPDGVTRMYEAVLSNQIWRLRYESNGKE
jgi:hypothetical protein